MSGATNNLAIIEGAKQNLTLDKYRNEHYDIPLKELKLVSPNTVQIGTDEFPLSDNGQQSLCNILEIPWSFNARLHADDSSFWQMMVKRLEELRDTSVRFSINFASDKARVIAFNKAGVPWIPHDTFLSMLETVCNNDNLVLEKILMDETFVQAQLLVSNQEARLLPSEDEIFKLGLNLTNSEIMKFNMYVQKLIQRMICSNRATITSRSARRVFHHTGSGNDLVSRFYARTNELISEDISLQKFLEEQLRPSIGIPASVRELEESYKLFTRKVKSFGALNIDDKLPMREVTKAYGVELGKQSERWKSTASTPIELYKLYNEVTDLASNSEAISDGERLELQIGIGNVFFDHVPDMRDIAKSISWN